jgi:hypothetical protein
MNEIVSLIFRKVISDVIKVKYQRQKRNFSALFLSFEGLLHIN